MLVDIIEALRREFNNAVTTFPSTNLGVEYSFTGEYKFERTKVGRGIIFRGDIGYIKGTGAGGAQFSPERQRGENICEAVQLRAKALSEEKCEYEKLSLSEFKIIIKSCSEEVFNKELLRIRESSSPAIEVYKF